MTVPGIKGFGKVNEYLYRGAQPKEEGIEELKKLGIDTIVDLRGERHGLMEKERAHAESLGMRLVSIPGTGWTAPRDEQIAQFFALVSETPRRRIFVHCWFGGDRDGMFVAAYRVAFDGWTAEEAVHEMRAFHYNEFLHPNMKWYVRKFPKLLTKSPVLAPYREMSRRDEAELRITLRPAVTSGVKTPEVPAFSARMKPCPRERAAAAGPVCGRQAATLQKS